MNDKTGVRLWAVLMTGLPYALFKLGAGWVLQSQGHQLVGWAMVCWGALDFVANLAALVAPKRFAYCLLAALGRALDRDGGPRRTENLMLAVDTLVTFVIVSAMIWFGGIPRLPATFVPVWNAAVIANITGVGLQRVWLSAREMG